MEGYNIVGRESKMNRQGAMNSQLPSVSGNRWKGLDLTPLRLFLTLGQRDDQPEIITQTGIVPPDRTDNEVLPEFRTIRRNG